MRLYKAILVIGVMWFGMAVTAHARGFTRGDGLLEPGWWHDPAQPGIAFTLAPAGTRLASAILTFDDSGEPVWYLAVGEGQGNRWDVPVMRYTWDATTQAPSAGTRVGSLSVRAIDRDNVQATWDLPGRTGSATLQALRFASGYASEDHSGQWALPGDAGHGLTMVSDRGVDAIVYYAFDGAGQPRWAFGTATPQRITHAVPMVSYRVACPTCAPSTRDAGEVRIGFSDEANGTFSAEVRWADGVPWRRSTRALSLLSDLPSGRAHPGALARMVSSDATRAYLLEGLSRLPSLYGACLTSDVGVPAPPVEAALQPARANADEPGAGGEGLVAADGEYAYSIFIDDARANANGVPIGAVRAYRLAPAQADLTLAGTLDLTTATSNTYGFAPDARGVILIGPEQGARALIGVRQEQGRVCSLAKGKVALDVMSLADRAQPRIEHRVRIDGFLVATRRIGRTVFVITRQVVDVSRYAPNGVNAPLLANASVDELLPTISIDGATSRAVAAADEVWLPPLAPDARAVVSLTITAVPIDQPSEAKSFAAFIDLVHGLYVSPRAVYLTTTRDAVTRQDPKLVYSGTPRTDIHRIDLATLSYQASGTVDGAPGFDIDGQAFRLSEQEGRLRILTEGATAAGSADYHQLHVLERVGTTRLLTTIGRVPNAARPAQLVHAGESLNAVRFVGDRAYLETVRASGPLSSIDLSQPNDPRVGGLLDMPSFANFLNVLPTGQTLGVGKDVVATTSAGDGGRSAWAQGLALSLFDARDADAPTRLSTQSLGRRGTESALLATPQALAYQAPSATRGARIALPVSLTDATSNNPASADPAHAYDWVGSGVALFDIEGQQLRPRGLARVTDSSPTPSAAEARRLRDSALTRGRVLIVDDAVYYYADGAWIGAPWDAPDRLSPRR